MDETLAELRRSAEANPGDEQAARRYEAALLRAGRRDEVERLYTFKFHCPMDWNAMDPGRDPDPDARHCAKCERSVHFVRNQQQMERRVQEGACVAFAPEQVDALGFLLESSEFHTAQGAADPCLVEGEDPRPVPMPLAGVPLVVRSVAALRPEPELLKGKVARIEDDEPADEPGDEPEPPPPPPARGFWQRLFGGD